MPSASAKKEVINQQSIRKHLVYLLNGDGAHTDFDTAIKDIRIDVRGMKPDGASHSPWEVLEHLRICQWDILEAIKSSNHVSPEFPAGYWPKYSAPNSAKDWDNSVAAFHSDFAAILKLVNDEDVDLIAPLHGAADQSIMRKLLMLADHTSYHLGEMVLLRRTLSCWNL